ncbi:MAG: CDP-diacylglycerol--glycerol-3-phosphate 3-phosphatidyltransferase [Alphaproteobacteria bacterium]|nr:CDP-diacylglycerol--glycerol-3-phosphate 3-phosphatidyltransferase [Alphaproteobacteria bacterium]
MWNLPNILTVARLFLLPVIFVLFMVGEAWAAWTALAVYVVGAVTDWFDGYFARKHNLVTPFGTFLDPISDKIFVATLLVLLVGFERLPGWWMAVPIVILAREFAVSGMREFLGPYNIKVPVTKLAKWKTTSQMAAIALLIVGPYVPLGLISGQILLLVAMALTVITGRGYLATGLRHMNGMDNGTS